MGTEQRLRLWKALGRYDSPVEVLELGSAGFSVGDGEMKEVMELVVASSPPCLDCVRVLHLDSMNSLTDASLQALAQAGCGKNLTSLTLRGACLFPFLGPWLQRKK